MPLNAATKAMKSSGMESAGGFYDVERTFGGALYRLDDHLARLYRGLEYSELDPGITSVEMANVTSQLVAENVKILRPGRDFLVTQIVSVIDEMGDGQGGTLGDCKGSGGKSTNLAIFCQLLDFSSFALSYGYGVHITTPDTYAIPVNARRTRQLNFPLMTDAEGNVTECQGGNFMFVREGRINLPNRDNVLPGVSMQTVLELAAEIGLDVAEDDYCVGDVYLAEEAFISSTRFCMLPVASINGLAIGAQMPGPITRRLIEAWIDEVEFDFVAQALDYASANGLM